jgi:hypothetical protein
MAARAVTADGPVAGERLTRDTARDGLSRLAVGSGVGFLAGALIGGVGGRLAMLLLRVTSDSSLIGMTTDDGFRTGSFTTDTFFLVAITAIGGAGLGAAYVAVRRWLPRGHRPAVAAVVLGAIGGAAIIDPEGLDFTVLDPLWLAVAMFIALPAAFGAALARGVERLIPWASDREPSTFGLLVPLLPIVLFPVMAVLVGLVVLAWAALRRWPGAGRLWWSAPVTVGGRAVGIGATVLAAIVLAQDAAEIL